MRFLFACFFIFFGYNLQAQTSQGGWIIGGSAGFTSASSNSKSKPSVLTVSVNPIVGYFIFDRVALGSGFTIESVTRQYFKLGAGPVVRYYFLQIGERANLIAQTGFYYGFFNPYYGDKRELYEVSFDLGLSYFINENVALETILNYTNTNATNYTDLGSTKARKTDLG